jgi:hypothetical protein
MNPVRPAVRPSRRGLWTIVAIFVLGGLVLAGLFMAPRRKPPLAPPDMPWAHPGQPVTVVSFEIGPARRNAEPVTLAAMILAEEATPDFVFLLDIEADQLPGLAKALDMQASYDPRLYQRVPRTPGGKELVGVAILSRHSLFEAAPVRRARKLPDGVSAVAAAHGSKVLVGCLWRAGEPEPERPDPWLSHWEALGCPPAIVVFRQPTQGAEAPTEWRSRGWHSAATEATGESAGVTAGVTVAWTGQCGVSSAGPSKSAGIRRWSLGPGISPTTVP